MNSIRNSETFDGYSARRENHLSPTKQMISRGERDIGVRVWPAAGGGVLVEAHLPIFAPYLICSETKRSNLFLILDSSELVKVIVPYVRLATESSLSIADIVSKKLDVARAQVEVIDIAARRVSHERNVCISGQFEAGGGVSSHLAAMSSMLLHLLIAAAARTWNAPIEACVALRGRVVNRYSDISAPYGEFCNTAAFEQMPDQTFPPPCL
jgi:hypothetical protein